MKKIFAVAVAAMLIVMSGCAIKRENTKLPQNEQEIVYAEVENELDEADDAEEIYTEPDEDEEIPAEVIVDADTSEGGNESSENSVSDRNLTEEEVIELCYEKYGKKDDLTGFELFFVCMETLEENGEVYYAIDFKWLVDNHHLSTIDMFAVAAKNGEIYNLERDSSMEFDICDSRGEIL